MNLGQMMKVKRIVPGLLLICAACGNKQATRPNIPTDASPQATPAIARQVSSADVVKMSVPDREITAGGSAQANVRIVISQGYHINANPPTFPYLIATKLEASESKEITIGTPVYPTPLTKTFSFAEKPLAVYEGETTINLPLQAAGDAAKGARLIPLLVRVQACDDSTCYAPVKIDLSLNLTVK